MHPDLLVTGSNATRKPVNCAGAFILLSTPSSGLALNLVTAITAIRYTTSQAGMLDAAVPRRLAVVRITIVIFMFIHEQVLVSFCLDHQEYTVHSGGDQCYPWPVLKLPLGSALGNTSTITANGKIAIRYCLMPPRLTY